MVVENDGRPSARSARRPPPLSRTLREHNHSSRRSEIVAARGSKEMIFREEYPQPTLWSHPTCTNRKRRSRTQKVARSCRQRTTRLPFDRLANHRQPVAACGRRQTGHRRRPSAAAIRLISSVRCRDPTQQQRRRVVESQPAPSRDQGNSSGEEMEAPSPCAMCTEVITASGERSLTICPKRLDMKGLPGDQLGTVELETAGPHPLQGAAVRCPQDLTQRIFAPRNGRR